MKIRKYLGPQRLFAWHSIQAIACLLLIVTGYGMYMPSVAPWLMDFDARHEIHHGVGIVASVAYVVVFGLYHVEANRHRVYYWWRTFLYKTLITREKAHLHQQHVKHLVVSRYVVVMFLVFPLLVITGWFLLFPGFLLAPVAGIDLYYLTIITHITCSVVVSLFLIVHVYIVLINKKKATWLHTFLKYWYKW